MVTTLSDLPNELLLKIFIYILHVNNDNSYSVLWSLRRTCKKWRALIPIVINDDIHGRFGKDLKFEIRMDFTYKSSYFHGKFETFEKTSTFQIVEKSSSSDTEEESKEGSPRSMNPGETCCAIHLEITVKQFPSSLPFGWRTKEYIPTISFPDENACDVKQAKFGMGMIMGYKLSPCTDVLADDIFRLRISNNKNSKGVNGVNLSERGKDDINSSGSNSSGDVTVHSSVAPCNGIELIYLKVPGKVLLELVDALDSLADSNNDKPKTKFSFTGKFYKFKRYEDVTGYPYIQRKSLNCLR